MPQRPPLPHVSQNLLSCRRHRRHLQHPAVVAAVRIAAGACTADARGDR